MVMPMARPKHNDPTLFVVSELEIATGFSKRNIQLLRDRALGPFHGTAGEYDGKYSEDVLAELAIIAAINSAGYPLLLSAPIASCFLEDKLNHPIGRFGWTDKFAKRHPHNTGGMSWFQAHCGMRFEDVEYRPGCVLDEDSTILVADRTFVAQHSLEMPRLKFAVPKGVDGFGPMPLGRLEGMVRAKDTRFIPIYDEITFDGGENEAKHYLLYQNAVKQALGLVRVNVSLAIRRAFDNIHDLRVKKGGPMFS